MNAHPVALPARRPDGRFLPGHALGGRPSRLTEEVAVEIVERVAAGMSLWEACQLPHLPSPWTAYRWAVDDDDGDGDGDGGLRVRFRQSLAIAREQAADRLAAEYERRARESVREV